MTMMIPLRPISTKASGLLAYELEGQIHEIVQVAYEVDGAADKDIAWSFDTFGPYRLHDVLRSLRLVQLKVGRCVERGKDALASAQDIQLPSVISLQHKVWRLGRA